jgi:hypothetical protein
MWLQFVGGKEDLYVETLRNYVETLRNECDKDVGGSNGSAINLCNNPATLGAIKSDRA